MASKRKSVQVDTGTTTENINEVYDNLYLADNLKEISKEVLIKDSKKIRYFFSLIATYKYRPVLHALQTGDKEKFRAKIKEFQLNNYLQEINQ